MSALVLIALAAGCASALMFASIISGALISLLLCYLAPLPLMVAALSWGPLSASLAGIAGTVGLAAIFGAPYGFAFALTVALPAWWLGHLALLGRPMAGETAAGEESSSATPEFEWYPLGRILLWIAGFAAMTTAAALFTLGGDAASITGVLRRGLLRILQVLGPQEGATSQDAEHWVDALVLLAPSAGAIVAMLTLALNLWLAAKITATSGRLHRPWPEFRSVTLPPMTLAATCVAVAFCFSGGLLAILAAIVTSALLMAYAFTGFAVLHTLTLGVKSRAVWLGIAYAAVVVFSWPLLVIVALGLADAVFGLRQRYWQRRPPPLPVP
jgi:hypothetical protein